jgi:hypothetical protein
MSPQIGELSTRYFSPHRKAVGATDSSAPTNAKAGVAGVGYEALIVDLVLESGSLSGATLELFTWSDGAGAFVSQGTAKTQAFTAPGQWVIDGLDGRRFWIKVTALTGTSPVIGIWVKAFNREREGG